MTADPTRPAIDYMIGGLEWRPGIRHPRPRSVYYWVGMGTKP